MDLQHLRASDGTGEAVLAHVSSPRTIGSTVLELDNVDNWNTKCIVVTGTPAANGYIAAAGMTIMYGHITAGDFIIDGYAPGYADNGNNTTQIAIVKMTTNWADGLIDLLTVALQDNGKLKVTSLDEFYKPSEVTPDDFIASGGIVVQTSGLTGSFSDIVYYINGLRYTKTGVANKVYTASKDTYVDIGTDGTVDYNEVANGAAAPALAADHVRVAKVVTSGAAITSVTQDQSNDLIGNMIYPKLGQKFVTFHKGYLGANATRTANSWASYNPNNVQSGSRVITTRSGKIKVTLSIPGTISANNAEIGVMIGATGYEVATLTSVANGSRTYSRIIEVAPGTYTVDYAHKSSGGGTITTTAFADCNMLLEEV